jgi:hypothetical protein
VGGEIGRGRKKAMARRVVNRKKYETTYHDSRGRKSKAPQQLRTQSAATIIAASPRSEEEELKELKVLRWHLVDDNAVCYGECQYTPTCFTKRDLNIHVFDDVRVVQSRKVIDLQFAFVVPLTCMTQVPQNV